MLYTFLFKYAKELIIVALVAGLGLMVYNKIVDNTMAKAHAEFAQQIEQFNNKLDARVEDLEALSSVLVKSNQQKDLEFSKRIDTKLNSILSATKDKPAFVIDTSNNQCTASSAFVDNYNLLIQGK